MLIALGTVRTRELISCPLDTYTASRLLFLPVRAILRAGCCRSAQGLRARPRPASAGVVPHVTPSPSGLRRDPPRRMVSDPPGVGRLSARVGVSRRSECVFAE
ncbi:hypothetical protein GCM10027059_27510 [Myceligenerans halotolerans]